MKRGKTKQHLAGVCDQEASRTNYPPQHLALGRESMLKGWSGLATCARSKARPTPKTRPSAHTFFSGASTRVRECVALAAAVCELSPGAASCLRGRRGENARTRHLLLFRTHQLLQLRSRNRLDRVRQARVPTLQVRECLFRCLSVISVCV